MAQLNFNADEVEPQAARGPLPTGEYIAMIVDSSKPAGKTYIELVYEVIEGPRKGSKHWHYLNLEHSNTQTVEIARAQLSCICHVIGRLDITDSQQLHNIPHVIRMQFIPAAKTRNGDRDESKIMEWKSRGAGATTAPAAGQPYQAPAPASAPAPAAPAASAPWKRQAA